MCLSSLRYRLLFPVKTDNMLWWASLLMFIGAMGFNISNIAAVLVGDAPLDLSTSQEVGDLLPGLHCISGYNVCGWRSRGGGGGGGGGGEGGQGTRAGTVKRVRGLGHRLGRASCGACVSQGLQCIGWRRGVRRWGWEEEFST